MSANRWSSYSTEDCPTVLDHLVNRPNRPIRRRALWVRVALATATFVCLFGGAGWGASWGQAASPVSLDLAHKPLPRLQPGIVLGQQQDFGYSDLVTIVLPRLASGDVDSLPQFARRYAGMFNLTIMANVVEREADGQKAYLLDKIGVGFAMDVGGKLTIVTSESATEQGANLGMIDRGVLSGNEECLVDMVQVARTDRLVVFDAKANVLIGEKHESRILRHMIWASPASGKLGFLVWQLKEQQLKGKGADSYAIDSASMQLLPAGFREDRRIHVSPGNFLTSKIPTPDRFALESIPQGTPVPFADRMKQVGGLKNLSTSDLDHLLAGVSESLAMLQVPSVARKP